MSVLLAERPLVETALGDDHGVAVSDDGAVYTWGHNGSGQCGSGVVGGRSRFERIVRGSLAALRAVSVTAGSGHSLALDASGQVHTWGRDAYALDARFAQELIVEPVVLASGERAAADRTTAIAAGARHSVALGGDGWVYAWGRNGSGQLGDGTRQSRPFPTAIVAHAVPMPQAFTRVAAGGFHSLAIGADGAVYAWGDNSAGQVDAIAPMAVTRPKRLDALTRVAHTTFVAVAAGAYHSLALTEDGRVFGWGANAHGQIAPHLPRMPRQSPTEAGPRSGALVRTVAIAAGEHHSTVLDHDGLSRSWGEVQATHGAVTSTPSRVRRIAGGAGRVALLFADGRLASLGRRML